MSCCTDPPDDNLGEWKMARELRKTGIEILGDAPWGTHFCQFYHTREDLLDILVPYFKAGLESHESCMWITSEPLNGEEAEEGLRQAIPEFDTYLGRGQMEIVPHSVWYLEDGSFNAERVLNGWIDKLNAALIEGYEGLRVTGNTHWLEETHWPNFMAYERHVNNVIGEHRMLAICSYALGRCGASEIIDVVNAHQFALIRRQGKWERVTSWSAIAKEIESLARLSGENPNPVLRILKDGSLCYRNSASSILLQTWGVGSDERISGDPYQFVLEALDSAQSRQTELECGDRTFSLTFAPVVDSDYVNVYGLDITERKLLEEQLRQSQKMGAVGQLAGGIAHDFNNLLQGILGHASLLKLEADPRSSVYDGLKTIESAAEVGAKLTRQLLGFAGKGRDQVIPVDVHAAIHEVLALVSRTMDKSIRITTDLAAPASVVKGDPNQLQQALLNLAINAGDAMPRGGELTICTDVVDLDETYCRTHPETAPGRCLFVSIADTGRGIPKDILQRVFEPFFSTKEPSQGSGMGLAMVYGIVKNHGGNIEVSSDQGQGATFKIYLPIVEESGAAALASERGEPVRGAGRVLLAEDEELVREVTTRMLQSLGYQVVAMPDGEQAVDYFREHPGKIDVAVIDMIMPNMDGRETFQALKQIDPGIKAVLCTGYDRNERVQGALDDGILGFAHKPYDLKELSEALASVLNQ